MIARLEVTRGPLTEYPLAEKVPGGWQNGVTFYPDAEVLKVIPLHVSAEPQAEPTEAQADLLPDYFAPKPMPQGWVWAEPQEVDADPDTAFELGRVAGYDEAMREMRGEPTDAQVRAAARAVADLRKRETGAPAWFNVDHARAALTAAYETKGEGR